MGFFTQKITRIGESSRPASLADILELADSALAAQVIGVAKAREKW